MTVSSANSSGQTDLHTAIDTSRAEARAVCDDQGVSSQACAAAWDAVEELQATAAHQQAEAQASAKTSLQRYCDDHPDAAECRIYED